MAAHDGPALLARTKDSPPCQNTKTGALGSSYRNRLDRPDRPGSASRLGNNATLRLYILISKDIPTVVGRQADMYSIGAVLGPFICLFLQYTQRPHTNDFSRHQISQLCFP